MTCTCGDYMTLRDPVELVFEQPPGSVSARRLAYFASAHPWTHVWSCSTCDRWIPTA